MVVWSMAVVIPSAAMIPICWMVNGLDQIMTLLPSLFVSSFFIRQAITAAATLHFIWKKELNYLFVHIQMRGRLL